MTCNLPSCCWMIGSDALKLNPDLITFSPRLLLRLKPRRRRPPPPPPLSSPPIPEPLLSVPHPPRPPLSSSPRGAKPDAAQAQPPSGESPFPRFFFFLGGDALLGGSTGTWAAVEWGSGFLVRSIDRSIHRSRLTWSSYSSWIVRALSDRVQHPAGFSWGGGGGAMAGCGGGWVARLAALLVVGFVLGSVDASLGDVDPQYRWVVGACLCFLVFFIRLIELIQVFVVIVNWLNSTPIGAMLDK